MAHLAKKYLYRFEWVIILIASGTLIAGIQQWIKSHELLTKGIKTIAEVVDNSYKTDEDGKGFYYPIVRFETPEKELVHRELSQGYSPAQPKGKKIPILYNPNNSGMIEMDSSFHLKILPKILTTLGIVGLAFGVIRLSNFT